MKLIGPGPLTSRCMAIGADPDPCSVNQAVSIRWSKYWVCQKVLISSGDLQHLVSAMPTAFAMQRAQQLLRATALAGLASKANRDRRARVTSFPPIGPPREPSLT